MICYQPASSWDVRLGLRSIRLWAKEGQPKRGAMYNGVQSSEKQRLRQEDKTPNDLPNNDTHTTRKSIIQ